MRTLTHARVISLTLCIAALLAAPAGAQVIPTFTDETGARLVADPPVGASDTTEKDFGIGDLDGDGDLDVVVSRRLRINAPTGEGAAAAAPNTLFMNENGVLTDKTAALASALLTSVSSRDTLVRDLDGDGLLDVLIADGPTNLPLLLLNQGSSGGNWLGLAPAPAGLIPVGFTLDAWTVSAGDLKKDGDAFPDLFFGVKNGNDRILINLGEIGGVWQGFADESTRLGTNANTSAVRSSAIVDINLDGDQDIIEGVTNPTGAVRYLQNDGTGAFTAAVQTINSGSAYNFGLLDLNVDGRQDFYNVKNGTDQYLLNTGNGAGDLITLGTAMNAPNTSGFGAIAVTADLNYDGTDDVLVCDLDQEFPADCARRLKIYVNSGTSPFLVEAYPTQKGWTPNGTSDVALVDLDGDGDLDMFIGHCTGLSVWMQDGSPAPKCPGDIDKDGKTCQSDLGVLLAAFGSCEGQPGYNPAANLATTPVAACSGAQGIDQSDLGVLLADYGCGGCP